MTPDTAPLLDRVRTLCLALPATVERESDGAPIFAIEDGEDFACFTRGDRDGCETAVLVRTTGSDEQTQLIALDPACYYKPTQFGASGWIALRLHGESVDWDRVGDRIAISWELAAPQRLLEAGGR